MPPRHRNEHLRALLTEARWTQASLARSVNALAAEIDLDLTYDRTAVAHWLSGTRPTPPAPELIAEALTRRLGRVVSRATAGFPDDSTAPPPAGPAPEGQGAETALAALCGQESDPARRVSARRLPYRKAELAGTAGAEPRWPGPAVGARRPDEEGELSIVRFAVRFYSASFNAHGGGSARTALAAYLADDIAPRLRETHDPHTRRGLLVESSRLSFLLARMHQDASVHGLAQRHFNTALQLAAESGDRTAWAVVLRGLSAQGLALGHRRTALHAAEAAVETTRSAHGAAGAYLLSQLAVAQAACGAHQEAIESLGQAEHALEAAEQGTGGPGPFQAYSRAALDFQSAEALRHVGDLPAARTALNRSLARRATEDRRGLALSYAQHAEILVGIGNVEEACAAWQSFLDHYGYLRSGAVDTALSRLRQFLTPFRQLPAAAAVLDRMYVETAARRRP